ncbi:MAG: rhodanese-like domain-containing protein [Alphaproteobacteria bacterium]|nr:rhodanese-like domain-containing protein [Alphaproteobacteria bacterium]
MDEEGGVLVDVRTPAEFAGSHAPGAINVPAGSVKQHLAALPSKDTPLVVHCASGTRSMMAVRELKAAGFTRVVDIATLGNALALPRSGSGA